MIKILIADDENDLRKLLYDQLTEAGYSVVEASDGKKAYEVFESEKSIGTASMKQRQATADVIQNTFTPEDVEIRETLYCLWIAE